MKGPTLIICIITVLFFGTKCTLAQDIHYNPFDATPLNINPAFTGMFDGNARVSGIYQNQWRNTTIPNNTYVLSADMPVFTDGKGNYLAAGLQVTKDVAGDENLSNFSALASLAYHKL